MDATKAKAIALAEMKRWGLSHWNFAFHDRKRALGTCSPKSRTISLSTYFLDKVSDAEVVDTILHEIAHALEAMRHGTSGHGPKWKAICREVGAKPVAKCAVKIHHPYPYVLKYEDKVITGWWRLPPNINQRLKTMALRGKPESKGKLKIFKVEYRQEA